MNPTELMRRFVTKCRHFTPVKVEMSNRLKVQRAIDNSRWLRNATASPDGAFTVPGITHPRRVDDRCRRQTEGCAHVAIALSLRGESLSRSRAT
jgi:hypothetical protein